jgi:hypothetical protein
VADDFKRFEDIESLLHHGHLSDSPWSLVMPLLSTPFLLFGEFIRSPEWWAARFNTFVVGVGAAAAFWLLRGRVDGGLMRRFLLVLLFASFLTNRLRDYNAEVLTSTLVALGLLLVVTVHRPVLGWAMIVIGAVNTPAVWVGVAFLAAAEAIRRRQLRHFVVPVAAAVLIMAEAWLRRDGPFDSGQGGYLGVATMLPYSGKSGFSYPLVLGVLSILISFGRGLAFFMPGLLLGLARRTTRRLKEHRRLVGLMVLYVAGLVLVYAKWWAWYGGVSWGPRYFVFAAIPASLFIVVRIAHAGKSVLADALTLLVLTFSAWVGVSGAIADLAVLDVCVRDNFAFEPFCWYVPEYSSLWRPLVEFPELTWSKALIAGSCAVVYAYVAAPLFLALARASRVPPPVKAWTSGWRL